MFITKYFCVNEYEQPLNLIKKKLQFNDNLNIIDGGANIGLFTVCANELDNPQHFILIEPLEGNVNLIKKNMAQSSIQCE